MSLQDFIRTHQDKLLSMTREKIAKRNAGSRSSGLEAKHGVPVFLEQLRGALDDEAARDPAQQAEADPPTNPDIERTAALHGHDLLTAGFSIEEVVHDYGAVCQAVTELAVQLKAPIEVADFHTLNRCLDNAIAAAVTSWCADRAAAAASSGIPLNEKLRRLLSGALAIFTMLRDGKVAPGGASVAMLGRHLEEAHALLNVSARSGTVTMK